MSDPKSCPRGDRRSVTLETRKCRCCREHGDLSVCPRITRAFLRDFKAMIASRCTFADPQSAHWRRRRSTSIIVLGRDDQFDIDRHIFRAACCTPRPATLERIVG